MFVKNFSRMFIRECFFVSQAAGDLSNYPPIRARFTRRGQEASLTRYTALGICDSTVFLSPARCGQEHMSSGGGISISHAIRYHDKFAVLHGFFNIVSIWHADQWVRGHNPEEFNLSIFYFVEQIDCLQSRFFCNAW